MNGSTVTSDAFARWDIVVVPLPYSERLAEKRRPAVVVSGSTLHREGFLWIVMVTGAGKTVRAGDVPIPDPAAAGLPGASMVRASKIATIEPTRIIRRVGRLEEAEQALVSRAVDCFLGD